MQKPLANMLVAFTKLQFLLKLMRLVSKFVLFNFFRFLRDQEGISNLQGCNLRIKCSMNDANICRVIRQTTTLRVATGRENARQTERCWQRALA